MGDLEKRKVFTGTVTNNSMEKTVTVVTEWLIKHPIYQRIVKRSKKYIVHDEKNECQIGDKVRIVETRPLSKRKRWRVVEILEKAK